MKKCTNNEILYLTGRNGAEREQKARGNQLTPNSDPNKRLCKKHLEEKPTCREDDRQRQNIRCST